MQTTPSTLVRLRARLASRTPKGCTETVPLVATAICAFAVLVFRYARCREIAIAVGDEPRRPAVASTTPSSDPVASLPSRDVIESFVGARGDVTLAWSEDDARLTLTVKIPSLAIVADGSFQRSLVATHDPMRDVRRHFR